MKCDRCNGTGRRIEESDNGIGWIPVKCEYCNGTGEVEQTEQEYIQTCDTEQLAEEIYECVMTHPWHISKEVILEWLKQPHREEIHE